MTDTPTPPTNARVLDGKPLGPRTATKYRPRRARYDGGSAPRTLCFDPNCRAGARYQGVHNLRFYCPAHAAEVAAIVPLRDIDGLTEAMR